MQIRKYFQRFQKKYGFCVGGTHIDVTTLERNHYFFLETRNVSWFWHSPPAQIRLSGVAFCQVFG